MTNLFASVHKAIDDPAVNIVSFDFFDTLVVRSGFNPASIFCRLGDALKQAGFLPPGFIAERFISIRTQAERRAREAKSCSAGTYEVNLREIYAAFPEAILESRNFGLQDLVDIEENVEFDAVSLFGPMVECLERARTAGKQVIIVSDTYFSRSFFEKIFAKSGVKLPSRLFLSHEVGEGKGGGLWSVVLDLLKVSPGEILHIGDNYHADVEMPSRVGVRGLHAPHGSAEFFSMVNDEFAVVSDKAYVYSSTYLTALRAKSNLLVSASSPYAAHWNYGYQILGPVFHGLARFAVETYQATKCDAVLPFAREGVFLRKLVDQLPGRHIPLLSPLSISRRHMRLVGLCEPTVDKLVAAFGAPSAPTIRDIACLLNLDANVFEGGPFRLDEEIGTYEKASALAEFIMAAPGLVSSIRFKARQARDGLRKHLNRCLAAGGIDMPTDRRLRLGVLDIGWNGSIQSLLQEWFNVTDTKIDLVGTYLMSTETTNSIFFNGAESYGYLIDGQQPVQQADWLFRTLEILEQSSTPVDIGSLAEFTRHGMPIEYDVQLPEFQKEQIESIQSGIMAYHALALSCPDADVCAPGVRALLRAVLERAFVQPTRNEIRLFEGWVHDENLMSQQSDSIFSDDLAWTLPFRTPRQLLRVPMAELYWPFALAESTDKRLAAQTKALRCSVVSEEDLEEQVGHISLIRQGSETELGRWPLSVNLFGRGLVEGMIACPGNSIRLSIELNSPIVIEFSRVTLECKRSSDTGKWLANINENALDARVFSEQGEKIGRNTYLLEGKVDFLIDLSGYRMIEDNNGSDIGIRIAYHLTSSSIAIANRTAKAGLVVDEDFLLPGPKVETDMSGWMDSIAGVEVFDATEDVFIKLPSKNSSIELTGWVSPTVLEAGSRSALKVTLLKRNKTVVLPAKRFPRTDLADVVGPEKAEKAGIVAMLDFSGLPFDEVYQFSWTVASPLGQETADFPKAVVFEPVLVDE